MKRVKIRIEGKVQGVFYRASTKAKATELKLRGWVKNLPGGGVELEAQGEEYSLRKLKDWCHGGPETARVTQVICEEILPIQGETAFIIKY